MRSEIADAEHVGVEVPPTVRGRREEHRDRCRCRERDSRLIAVVHRLEQHDLVAGIEHPEHCPGKRFRRARGDDDLRVGVHVEPIPAVMVLGDRATQIRVTQTRRVLVHPGANCLDRRIEHFGWPVGVGESLSEIDRTGRRRERRHLREDRRAEAGEFRGQDIARHSAGVYDSDDVGVDVAAASGGGNGGSSG